jgi:unsaturated rhamnogalacturonyl hydrolase
MLRQTVICIILLVCCSSSLFSKPKNKYLPENTGRNLVANLLDRKEIMMYRSDFLNTFHYAEACAELGAVQLAQELHDSLLLTNLDKKYKSVINDLDTLHFSHVDANVLGIIPLTLYQWNKNPDYLKKGLALANQQWKNPLPDGLSNQTRYWIDDIFMIGSLQVEAYKVTGETEYLNRAAREIRAYLVKLQQPNGLFFHGPNAHFFWGRGNGWVAAGMTELLSVLPPDHKDYQFILECYRRMMDSLVHFQSSSGLWRQLIDKKDAWEETSSSAMFGYALCEGVNKGLLTHAKFRKAYKKAWNALVDRMDGEANLIGVCEGTGQSQNIDYYLSRSKIMGDLHGQAPMLWFANALLEKE